MFPREWHDLHKAPGSDVVRLCAVRVRTEDGRITDTVNIRKPVGIEIEYEVLKPSYVFHPCFSLHNSEGVHLFSAQDVDPTWQRQPRSTGRYVSTGWIPGNLLSEGTMSVGPAMWTLSPNTLHFYVEQSVAFRVIDSFEEGSARGAWPNPIPGIVRPLLKWNTLFTPNGR